MKEIKFLLICLASAAYTSLWWACAIFNWIFVGPLDGPNGQFPLGIMLLVITTLLIILGSVLYVSWNWNKE